MKMKRWSRFSPTLLRRRRRTIPEHESVSAVASLVSTIRTNSVFDRITLVRAL